MAAPMLLNEDGTASVATALMSSHHGFRRDLLNFSAALESMAHGDRSRAGRVRDEWSWFHRALHGHHAAEDGGIFPGIRATHPAVAPTLDRLSTDHARIDPLLARGDLAFEALPDPSAVSAASAVIAELRALLAPHLATEEAEVIPHLRQKTAIPPPASDAEVDLYAEGFSWSTYGLAPEVIAQIDRVIPASVVDRLPAARAAFANRYNSAWGDAPVGAARTPVPESWQ